MDANNTSEKSSRCSSSNDKSEHDELLGNCQHILQMVKNQPLYASDELVLLLATLSSEYPNLNYRLVLRLLDQLQGICAWNDDEARDLYFRIIKTVFLKCENFNKVLLEYFNGFIKEFNSIPNWKAMYKRYDSDMTSILNRLGSHTQFEDNESSLLKLSHDFAWLLLLAPKPTLWHLLSHCFEIRAIVPSALKVLRHMSALSVLKLNHEGKDKIDVNKPVVSITLCVLSRILRTRKFKYSRELMKDGNLGDNDWDRYIYLVTAVSRKGRSSKQTKTISDEGQTMPLRKTLEEEAQLDYILTGTEILKGIVLPEIFSRRNIDSMLEIMLKLVSYYQGQKISVIAWRCDFDENSKTCSCISAPFLLRLLVDLYNENLNADEEIKSLCLKVFPAFGKRLEFDEVKFTIECSNSILNYLNGFEWSLKYAIATWFSASLGNPKREIPTGIYKALSEDLRQEYKQIVVDFDFTPSDCFFQSFYELVNVAPQLAIEIVNKGLFAKPSGDDLFVKLSYEFMLSVLKKPYQNFDKFCALFDTAKVLIRTLDHAVKPYMPFPITESAIYGLRLIEPFVMLGNVIIIGLSHDGNLESSSDCDKAPVKFTMEAVDKLLEHFCRMVKDHLEKELQDLRRSRLKYVPSIKEPLDIFKDVKVDRLNRVFTQVAELFFLVTMIARLYTETKVFQADSENTNQLPNSLKILLLKISQYQREVMDLMVLPNLDQFSNDMRKEPVFYAYANGSQEVQKCEIVDQKETSKVKSGKPTKSQQRRNALAKMEPSLFQVLYSDGSNESSSSLYFTKLARNVPDNAIREAVLRNVSGPFSGKFIFEQAINDIKEQASASC